MHQKDRPKREESSLVEDLPIDAIWLNGIQFNVEYNKDVNLKI